MLKLLNKPFLFQLFFMLAFAVAVCYNGNMCEEIKLNFDPSAPVAISRCEKYDVDEIAAVLETQLRSLGISPEFFAGRRVVVKPNLIMAASPDRMATTHPAVVEAALRVIGACSPASVTVAESPGGPYQPALLRASYNATGIAAAAKRAGATLNFDTSVKTVGYPDGKVSKSFELLTPAAEAEVIVNICKLKTHSLTQMTAAVKNLFGFVAGTDKVAMHARFPNPQSFSKYLVDLASAVATICPTLNIVDGIVGMEGNGPTAGAPKPFGCIITGRNPFGVDVLCEYLLRLEGQVMTTSEARARGLCRKDVSELALVCEGQVALYRPAKVVSAETKQRHILTHLPRFLRPRPVIDQALCVGCGVCAKSCPAETITMANKKAHIAHNKCILCYCCQEMCRFRAVKIRKNILLRLVR
ncbi:MAG: DUF362 domain-containing protein [Clostridiales bacterium]|jgi:uncharacterized protein (DUF362 family)|nr:DUF362 domain-containing protein [Clostridiales bacterium]